MILRHYLRAAIVTRCIILYLYNYLDMTVIVFLPSASIPLCSQVNVGAKKQLLSHSIKPASLN